MEVYAIWVPASNPVNEWFSLVPMAKDGVDYNENVYKGWVTGGIVLNCLLTYLTEKLFITWITKVWGNKKAAKKQRAFDEKLAELQGNKLRIDSTVDNQNEITMEENEGKMLIASETSKR